MFFPAEGPDCCKKVCVIQKISYNEVKDFWENLLDFRKHLTVTALLRKYIDQK